MTETANQHARSDPTLDSMLHTWEYTSHGHNDRKQDIFRYARQNCPVARTEEGGGFWLVTRYDDVKTVLEDWEIFSSTQAPIVPTPVSLAPLTEDPPFQSALRQLLNPMFSRIAVTRFEPETRELARDLIATWIDRGSVELISEYSGPYTSANLAQCVFPGFGPEELRRGAEIALRTTHDPTPQAFIDLLEFCTEYLATVRDQGMAGDGVIRRLMDGSIDGKPIPEDKLIGVLCVLVLGGLETTRGAIGNIAYRVATTPGLEDRLRDPGWTRHDLDELLRLDSPVTCMARVATRDVELNGAHIKAGERIQVRYDSANWDEDRFPNANTLVFDTERGGNAAFGLGVHRCVGSHLARFQIKVAFEELLARIGNLRLAPDTEITWIPGNTRQLHAVNLEFDRV
jgi:cytochrome P450